jgi:uncharacterized membrane protein (DUF485 family)
MDIPSLLYNANYDCLIARVSRSLVIRTSLFLLAAHMRYILRLVHRRHLFNVPLAANSVILIYRIVLYMTCHLTRIPIVVSMNSSSTRARL